MDSIINLEEYFELAGSPESKLKRYQACLQEFDRLNYDDPFIRQIRNEVVSLEKWLKLSGKQATWYARSE
ncbi:hypothetical protein EKG38_19225 [Shewanella canadensis]|uniref:Uncharacterized protein n=1 Tax=Shewanella canadensis TaxID=271096 RepID=A0A431WQ84_9GAMM|nr:hypothetical protein [Shewanella canadensis]RTR37335.1 hypothetical protein EKG38_19225 [Shewanella canadensis]